MALERGKLSEVVVVSASSTVGIITVASSKKVYIRSIAVMDRAGAAGLAATAHVYVVPNGDSHVDANKIFHIGLNKDETALVEPVYPIVLDTTGDSLRVGCGTAGPLNVFITGDKEE